MPAIEPLKFTLMDGEEREFLLNMAGLRRVTKHGLNADSQMLELVSITLFEALVSRGQLTLAEFEDLLPPSPDHCIGFYEVLTKHCSPPANARYRPTLAGEAPSIQSSENSLSGPIGPAVSADPTPNIGT